jgi:DNA polymerase-1
MTTVQRSRLIVLDSMSLIHRAYHAVPRNFVTSTGELTNAVFGFANMLLRIMDEIEPDHAVAAFDLPGPTFRDEIYDSYKANREAPDDDLIAQFGRVRQLVSALGIPIFELPTYEADDMLGTIAGQAEDAGFDVWLVTGDRDAFQLVTPHVRVLSTNPRTGAPLVYDEAAVVDRWGIQPAQVVDFKGLVGDVSDNIPGVKGIGEKTAAQLLSTYEDIDEVYDNLDDVKPAVRRRLEGQEELARLSRNLATIVRDAPVVFEPQKAKLWQPDSEAVRSLLRELQFRNLAERMTFLDGSVSEPVFDLPDVAPEIIDNPADAKMLAGQLANAERSSIVPCVRSSSGVVELLGFGVAWMNKTAYVPTGNADDTLEELRSWLESKASDKVTFDSKLLYRALMNKGICLRGVTNDLLLAAYIATPNAVPKSIDDLLFRRRGVELESDLPPPPPVGSFEQLEASVVAQPAALRAAIVLGMAHELGVHIKDLNLTSLLQDMELPIARILGDMERRGITLDSEVLRELSWTMAKEISELESAIYEDAGREFNVNSPKQLGAVLFEDLGLPVGRKTKTGYSTASGVLEELVDIHPVVSRVLKFRELSKLRSTYVDALPELVSLTTGRLHTTFNQAGTTTGRLSSSSPNLQNIPIRTSRGREIRRAFVAKDVGWSLLAIDYSQIDLRVLAHISEDPAMCQAFIDGHDIHSATAALLHNVAIDQVSDEMRRLAKTTNFGIVYGISARGLASQTGLSLKEAGVFIENYFATYPGVQAYMEATVEKAHDRGYVETLFNRRRYLPELKSRAFNERAAAERMAINMPIQGTTADIMKMAMVRVDQSVTAENLGGRMLLQVHDDLLFEVPSAELERFSRVACKHMTSAVELRIPLAVEAKAGPNWRDMQEL